MPLVVAGQEDDRKPGDFASEHWSRRLTPRRGDFLLAHIGEAGQVIDPRTADDSKHAPGHSVLSSRGGAWVLAFGDFGRLLDLVPDLLLGEIEQHRQHDQED